MMKTIMNQIRDFLGEENELVESTNIALNERITSTFYGYFIISWLIFNWKLLYIAFFIDQEKIFSKTNLLRNEYLSQLIPSHTSWIFWFNFVIYPFLFTILFFWVFTYVSRIYYRKNLRNKKALKRIDIQESLEIKKEEKKLIQEQTKVIDENIKKAQRERKAQTETPEIIWEKEFERFRRSSLFIKFDQILDSIYKYGGKIKVAGQFYDQFDFEMNREILIFADSNNLITIKGDTISFTDKGKFFAKIYSQIKGGFVISNTVQA